MNCLNVCFVGVGSIGKRHIRNLHIVCEKRGIEVHIDALRRPGSKPLPADLGLRREFTYLSEIKEPYDIVFITNPTENHIETMEHMQPYGKHFFMKSPFLPCTKFRNSKNSKKRKALCIMLPVL